MKILHIHPSLNDGGIESMINGLVNAQCADHDVTVCSIFEPKETNQFWTSIDSRVKRTTLHKTKEGFSLKEIWGIYNVIKNGKFDVVHVHGCFNYYFLSVILLHSKVKFFYTVHSDAFMENNRWEAKLLPLKRFCFKNKWLRPVTISGESQKSFFNLYHCESAMIPNGVPSKPLDEDFIKKINLSQYRETDNTKLLINVGRVDTPKNQIVLCRCVQRMIDQGHDVVLLIAGPIARQDIYDEMSKYFSDRIVYLGAIIKAREYFSQCDVMVMPSIWEGLPVTLLEAMSVGCLPVCSPVGGIPNVVTPGKDGLLSKSSSEDDFTETLNAYFKLDEEKIKELRAEAVRTFENGYKISTTAKRYVDEYLK